MPAAISPTQRRLTAGDVTALLRDRSGRSAVHCGPLSGGTFAAVWRATLEDGTDVVVKIGPPADCPLLRYEQGMIPAEARYYRLVAAHAPEVPVPPVLYADDDLVVVGLLPGRPLAEQADGTADGVREQLGRALRTLHTVTGTRFGYDGPGRTGADGWREAFTGMTADLLADARDWGVTLPAGDAELLGAIDRHGDALDEVRTPSLIHFDLWDGNVLCRDGAFTGLVDGERYFWGDPLYDFVCTAIGQRMEETPGHPVLRGYYGANPPAFTGAQQRRLMLYRIQFYLLLLAEMPSRAMTGEVERERREWVTPLLLADLRELG
ncbi:phosphotransferase family protein [Dactylosporangium fulvum]|uniref:Aminoglycoside phosphotransferase family protein n=1 Tax=Dactylosporangium fulvum TaxID=53359 RepID=A0ABY5VND9_9ACTN|nr:aminoglycoside phosphotransferase family protein [Dactylosporangium fulvum]UWP78665.1 aminoglycoside phosphotransferase family protein [Dactylosporangium fulvum]